MAYLWGALIKHLMGLCICPPGRACDLMAGILEFVKSLYLSNTMGCLVLANMAVTCDKLGWGDFELATLMNIV